MRRRGQLARQALELQLRLRAVERVGDGRVEREQLAIVLRHAAEHEALLAHHLAAVGRSSPASNRRSVVLPLPFGPTTPSFVRS